MSNVRVEAYKVRSTGNCPQVVWQAMCDFGAKQWDEGSQSLLSRMDKTQKSLETWAIAFDFCRLSGKKETLSLLTEKYASIFEKAPPEWVNIPPQTPEPQSSSKGVTLAIMSLTNPESENYESARLKLEKAKTALLIKFTSGKALSWQAAAVEKLAKAIADATTWKLPIYGENLDVATAHLSKINADARTDADWAILFFCLRVLGNEAEFEDQAFQFAMAKGISPPSYAPLPQDDKSKWFETLDDGKAPEDDPTNDTITVSGALADAMHSIQTRTVQKLQTKPTVIIDMQGIAHIDFTSAMDFVAMHDKLALSKRSVHIQKPSMLVKQMLITAGLAESSIKSTWLGY